MPGAGELYCDCRADELDAIEDVLHRDPGRARGRAPGAAADPPLAGHALRGRGAPVLDRAAAALGRPVVGRSRGGASDASHFASAIPVTVDGLGPRGGKAHNPGEFVLAESLTPRAEVALALVQAVLSRRE